MSEKGPHMSTSDKEQSSQKKPDAKDKTAQRDKRVDGQDVCEKAPEWAEHQRFSDDDEPCDDGRSGRLRED